MLILDIASGRHAIPIREIIMLLRARSFRLIGAVLAGLAAVSGIPHAPAAAEECPTPLRAARRLVVVTAASMHALRAEVTMFTRAAMDQPWRTDGDRQPAVVGLAGLARGWPSSSRHDRRADQARRRQAYADRHHRLGPAFGHNASPLPQYVRLAAGTHFCVDDARSASYGQIVTKTAAGAGISGEDMATIDIYRRGLVVDYPTDRAAKAGSCIFSLDLWRSESKGTTGCAAMPESTLANLQAWSAEAPTAIAIIPAGTRQRFGACLP